MRPDDYAIVPPNEVKIAQSKGRISSMERSPERQSLFDAYRQRQWFAIFESIH
jgi:hypothetical protein